MSPNSSSMSLPKMDAALRAVESGVTPKDLLAMHELIDRIGGIENARSAIHMLTDMEPRDPYDTL